MRQLKTYLNYHKTGEGGLGLGGWIKLQRQLKVLSSLELIYMKYYWRYIFKNSFYSFQTTLNYLFIFFYVQFKVVFFSAGGGCVCVLGGGGEGVDCDTSK